MTSVQVRPEQLGDETAVAPVNDAAFGQQDESRIVDAIRRGGHTTISLVALLGSEIVGHILFTPVALESSASTPLLMALGPMAVLPDLQRHGIGSQLVRAGLDECARAGTGAVVVIGHPEFYPRFGFRPASSYGLRTEYAVPDDVFMALELRPGALAGHGGLIRYLPEFN